ncbi:site-specific DNA-methyltransferase [Modestobacter lapidis]|nr:site-specific DNA-methyltransferase [Modestobacter lapidis]
MEKLDLQSPDLTVRNIEALAELFPTVVTETRDADGTVRRGIDFDLLRQELSDHVVEGPQERYRMDWPGKRKALLAANAPIRKTLRPVREESVDFDTTKNLFIEGDNLEALKLLQESYLGKVKLIYIDPPYNTGNDFIYNDDFAETTAEYLSRSGQVDETGTRLVANTESNGRFHSDWLSMMYPRLKLARSLLRTDGAIFISIDDSEVQNLVRLAGSVFGEANHLATFIWKSKSGGANDSSSVAVDHEYIVAFARNLSKVDLNVDPNGVATTSYSQLDEGGRYALERLDKQNLQYSPSLDYDLTGPDGTTYRLTHKDPTRPNAIWRWSRERVQRQMGDLVFQNGNVYTKNYATVGTKPRSLFVDERFGRTRTGSAELRTLMGGDYIENPKPLRLIETLINIATADDSIVLDFFAGSGTTAHAVASVNQKSGGERRFVLVQIPERPSRHSTAALSDYASIADITKERIRRAGREIGQLHTDDMAVDVGYRVLKVDTPTTADVGRPPGDTSQDQLSMLTDSVVGGRTGEDLLFHVLLDWGLELSLPIARETVDDSELIVVDEGLLIACFAETLTRDVITAIAQRQPERAVFRDSAFTTDADRINAQQVFAQLAPHTELRTV